ncbi:hypothetical protein quinque_011363 [Culex quinquefasciatus]
MEHCSSVVFVLICCLMGNFILINDRERIVMAAEVQISASPEWKRPSREAFMTQNGHSAGLNSRGASRLGLRDEREDGHRV